MSPRKVSLWHRLLARLGLAGPSPAEVAVRPLAGAAPPAPAADPGFCAKRIIPAPAACQAVRQQAGTLYAGDAALPALPLHGCDRAHCSCRYESVAERRCGERRSGVDRRAALRFELQKPDRRSGRDRRRNHSGWDGGTI